jgi:hypothetical protein
MQEVSREKINEVVKLTKQLQEITGRKVIFESINKIIGLSKIGNYCSASFDFIDSMKDVANNMIDTLIINKKPTNIYPLKDWFSNFSGRNYQTGSENFDKSEPKEAYQELKSKGITGIDISK